MEGEADECWEIDWERDPIEGWQPGPEVTLELYREWRSPRRGKLNPEKVVNPVWEWLVRARVNAFLAADHFNEPDAYEAGPGWCFTRFGRASTEVADGRVIKISGEHEDSYDPDFYIYNDVTIQYPDGRLEFLLYPVDDFPPTDFHTATPVDGRILLIGNLGYPGDRKPGVTQVLELELATMRVTKIGTSGESPGWIHGHKAELSDDQKLIVIYGGKIWDSTHGGALLKNYDRWELSLETLKWRRLTRAAVERWQFWRRDEQLGLLGPLRKMENATFTQGYASLIELRKPPGFEPDLKALAQLYRLPVAYLEESCDRDEIARIRIDGVLVKFQEGLRSIEMTIEGELSEKIVGSVVDHLLSKLPQIEGVDWEARRR